MVADSHIAIKNGNVLSEPVNLCLRDSRTESEILTLESKTIPNKVAISHRSSSPSIFPGGHPGVPRKAMFTLTRDQGQAVI